ncbi:MAG: pentapeptide repeat-containing protein [Haliscomenobacter sp.]|nr:pentapeptide repeat-containing protein [Haliscomenobacter sp.]
MANEEHLAILKQGVEEWNRWRKENPKIEPDLSGADLERVGLEGADLERVDLSDANLCRAYLIGANLFGAILERADLRGASLMSLNHL